MMADFSFVIYALIFYMMFTISADNASSALSPVVGSGVRTFRQSIVILAIFGTIGAILQGSGVSQTLGQEIILESLPQFTGIAIVLTTALWGSGLLLGFVPVSSAYAIVGATIGVGLFLGAPMNWTQLFFIALGWLVSPFIAFFIAVFLLWYIIPLLRMKLKNPLKSYRFFSVMLTVSACFQAYIFGANRIGFATGPLQATVRGEPTILFWVAIAGLILGPTIMGRKFIKVLGQQITELDEGQAFSMTIGFVIAVYLLTLFGLPASFDVAIFGGTIGAGYSKGLSRLKFKTIRRLLTTWIVTIFLSIATGYILAWVFKIFGG